MILGVAGGARTGLPHPRRTPAHSTSATHNATVKLLLVDAA